MTTTYHTTQTRVAIRDLPAGERPQERLLRHGPATLSSAELLALVLGLPELAQAESLLAGYGSMGELARRAAYRTHRPPAGTGAAPGGTPQGGPGTQPPRAGRRTAGAHPPTHAGRRGGARP